MKKINSKLFNCGKLTKNQMTNMNGGENIGTCYGTSTLDTIDKTTSSCDDIKYSSASAKADWKW